MPVQCVLHLIVRSDTSTIQPPRSLSPLHSSYYFSFWPILFFQILKIFKVLSEFLLRFLQVGRCPYCKNRLIIGKKLCRILKLFVGHRWRLRLLGRGLYSTISIPHNQFRQNYYYLATAFYQVSQEFLIVYLTPSPYLTKKVPSEVCWEIHLDSLSDLFRAAL